jgi:hypothetical protein
MLFTMTIVHAAVTGRPGSIAVREFPLPEPEPGAVCGHKNVGEVVAIAGGVFDSEGARLEVGDRIVTHRMPLRRAQEAVELAQTDAAMKIVITPNGAA